MMYQVLLETADDLSTYLYYSGTQLKAVVGINCVLTILHMEQPSHLLYIAGL